MNNKLSNVFIAPFNLTIFLVKPVSIKYVTFQFVFKFKFLKIKKNNAIK